METAASTVSPAPRRSAVGLAASASLLVLLVSWELVHPTLPVPFELALASRAPGAASWLCRLPMALSSIAGLVALYIFLTRTAERRAGVYAVAILATTPAWFVHGRMMTGAIVPMACAATVLAGLGVAMLDPHAKTTTRATGALAALLATLVAILSSRWGIPPRGLVPIVAVPTAAIALAALLSPRRSSSSASALLLTLALLVTLAAALTSLLSPDSHLATLLLGARAVTTTSAGATTFDAPVAALAYGLVPWVPLVPFALARRPTSPGHLAIMIAAVLAIAAHAALGPRTGSTTIVGLAAIAGALATMLRSLEETPRPAAALVASLLAIAWLIAHDVALGPDRVLVAFGASDAAVPAAQATASSLAIRSSLWLCTALACFALVTPRTWLPTGRGLAIVAGGVVAGLVLRGHAYPELLARLSPGAAFDAWAKRHHAGEPLGLVGVDRRAVAFAPGTAIVPQPDAPAAGRWLASAAGAPSQPRRFLALSAAELPRVNAEFRAARAFNVPVLAGSEGMTLLASSALVAGERSVSPLDAIVLGAAPPGLHPLGAVLDDRLDAIGWQLVDDKGRAIEAIPRGQRTAHVRFFVAPRPGARGGLDGYCTFLHIDHSPARFSAEHREHPYPMTLWRPGDVIADDFDVKLPAHFRAGSYRMYWGVGVLPCSDDRRLHVTSGESDGHDRLVAGSLEVR